MSEKNMKGATSRARAPNFTKDEQLLLVSAMEPYNNIIECKKTDSTKQIDKQNAWSKVAEVYNANTKGALRPVENLISCYRNTKSRLKKRYSEAKMLLEDPDKKEALINALAENGKNWDAISTTVNIPLEVCENSFLELQKIAKKEDNVLKRKVLGTGGGPPPSDDNPLAKIKKFIDPQIDGLYTIYDADASLMDQFQKTKPLAEQSQPIETSFLEYDVISPGPSTSNSNYIGSASQPTSISADRNIINGDTTPTLRSQIKGQGRIDILRKRKAPELEPDYECSPKKKKKNVNESFLNLSQEKIELVRLRKQLLEMDIQHKAEIYKLELDNNMIQENKFKAEVKLKELLLLDMKIKKESQ